MAARNLRLEPGQAILTLEEQFPSNVYSWMRLAEEQGAELLVARRRDGEDWTAAVIRTAEESASQVQVFARYAGSRYPAISITTLLPGFKFLITEPL